MADPQSQQSYPMSANFASPWYMLKEDNLRLTSYNALASVRLEVRYRFVDTSGCLIPSQEAQTPNTDRTAKASIFITPEGWLLGGEVFVSGAAPLIGQTYVVIEIVRGVGSSALPLQVIAAGYVSAKQPLPFPGVQITSSLDSGGAIRSIAGATPGAGAEISETVPTGARWELLSFGANLVTSGAAANRMPVLTLDDGTTIYFRGPMNVNEVASGTWLNYWTQGLLVSAAGPSNVINGSIPIGVRLGAGHRIRTVTAAIQAGDQWGTVQYLVREWLEGA
jgi:hypothetical protein